MWVYRTQLSLKIESRKIACHAPSSILFGISWVFLRHSGCPLCLTHFSKKYYNWTVDPEKLTSQTDFVCMSFSLTKNNNIIQKKNKLYCITFGFFFFNVHYSTLLHLPPLRSPPPPLWRRMLGSNSGLLRLWDCQTTLNHSHRCISLIFYNNCETRLLHETYFWVLQTSFLWCSCCNTCRYVAAPRMLMQYSNFVSTLYYSIVESCKGVEGLYCMRPI